MTRYRDHKEDARIEKEWFAEHRAEATEYRLSTGDDEESTIRRLRWGKPGSSNYRVSYTIQWGLLFVHGDLGEAVFAWNKALTWEWLAGLDLRYFAGKCLASEVGRDFSEWSESEAQKWLDERIGHWWNGELDADDRTAAIALSGHKYSGELALDWSEPTSPLSGTLCRAIRDAWAAANLEDADADEALEACGDRHAWNQFAHDHPEEFDDCYGIGTVVHLRCRAMWLGLKLAAKQLAAAAAASQPKPEVTA